MKREREQFERKMPACVSDAKESQEQEMEVENSDHRCQSLSLTLISGPKCRVPVGEAVVAAFLCR